MKYKLRIFMFFIMLITSEMDLSNKLNPLPHYDNELINSFNELRLLKAFILTEPFISDIYEVNGIYFCKSIGADNDLGILQIREIMIIEYNRIFGTNYKLHDVFKVDISVKIFLGIQRHKNPRLDLKLAANVWNCGSVNKHNPIYFNKILKNYR